MRCQRNRDDKWKATCCLFNLGESGCFFKALPDATGLARKGKQAEDINQSSILQLLFSLALL